MKAKSSNIKKYDTYLVFGYGYCNKCNCVKKILLFNYLIVVNKKNPNKSK